MIYKVRIQMQICSYRKSVKGRVCDVALHKMHILRWFIPLTINNLPTTTIFLFNKDDTSYY